MVEPNTAYLHVGVNGVHAKNRVMKWAVGVQNFFRELLPFTDITRRRKARLTYETSSSQNKYWSFFEWISVPWRKPMAVGDGVIRIQARRHYLCDYIIHPLMNWKSNIEIDSHAATNLDDRNDSKVRTECQSPEIEVALSIHADVKAACEAAIRSFPKPLKSPSLTMISDPVWTTWARYHWNIDQNKIEEALGK